MRSLQVSRETLDEEVWSTPMSHLAPKYQISDVALKKLCRRMNVPTPKAGYWQRVRSGQKVRRTPLPPASGSHPVAHTFVIRDGSASFAAAASLQATPALLAKLRPVSVPDKLASPHPLVRETRSGLGGRSTDPYGRLERRYLKVLDVSVSPAALPRALRIMDALLKEALRLGFAVGVKDDRYSRSYVEVEGIRIAFGIVEEVKRDQPGSVKRTHDRWGRTHTYTPTGKLSLLIKNDYLHLSRKRWEDSERGLLEDQLQAFFEGALIAAAAAKRREAEREEEREQARREAQRAERERERRRLREACRQMLLQDAAKWQDARRVATYIEEVGRRGTLLEMTPRHRIRRARWLRWARRQARTLDPHTSALPYENGVWRTYDPPSSAREGRQEQRIRIM